MNKYIFLIDQNNNEETIYNAIPAGKIETLKVTDTYDRYGQAVTPADAGASVILDSQKAVIVANSEFLSQSNFYVYINDHDANMNVIADNEEQIKEFIESNYDCKWEEVKEIEDVTQFYEGNGDINDFDGADYKVLIKSLPYKGVFSNNY